MAAAGIVNQEARGKVVAAVNHGIVAGHHVGVVFCKAGGDGLYLHLAVKPTQAPRGTFRLRLSHFVLAIEHLAVKVRNAHDIVVHNREAADTGTHKIKCDGAAQSARADKKHTGAAQFFLPLRTDFRQEHLPGIAAIILHHGCSS